MMRFVVGLLAGLGGNTHAGSPRTITPNKVNLTFYGEVIISFAEMEVPAAP